MTKKLLLSIYLAIIICNSQTKQPHETTWMELTKTDNAYLIKNYPAVEGDIVVDEIRIVNKIIVKQDSLIDIYFSEAPLRYKLDSVKYLNNETYIFVIRRLDKYKFEWVNKEKHIARWRMFYDDGRISMDNLYIDSAYNTYPIVDCVWHETCDVE